MTKEETKQAIKIMQAYADGKEIDFKDKDTDKWIYNDNKPAIYSWNWQHYDYRIKPESHYVPFTFEDRELFRGKWVRLKAQDKHHAHEFQINDIGINGVGPDIIFACWDALYKDYEFFDGTPCGKLVQ